MVTKITIQNFKGLKDVSFELGDRVVLIGPNNSGKTSALQALALWYTGLTKWIEKRGFGSSSKKRQGVTVNRRELMAVSVPVAKHLWNNLRTHSFDKQIKRQQNIRINIIVEGVSNGKSWICGLEFDYANEESFYCRPLRQNDKEDNRMPIPPEAGEIHVAYLPPMSGLTATETRLDPGAIHARMAEGRTAEVLRNLCFRIFERDDEKESWRFLKNKIQALFGIVLEDPVYHAHRGEISLSYTDQNIHLDITAAGRGLQQTILLLAHMMLNPNSILLLDEPDAHLEILRQRQIYQVLTEISRQYRTQLIAASHSEIILNEAADRDMVIAFVGIPHRIDDRGSQVLKALKEIGYDQYYQAEESGWVLYLEGSTDLAILRTFAKKIDHPAFAVLERPFVHYVGNQPKKAHEHFFGLREAKKDLRGIAVYDRLDRELPATSVLVQHMWKCREIENYLCTKEVILSWVEDKANEEGEGGLFAWTWIDTMEQLIANLENALQTLEKESPWGCEMKVTDDFLDPLFKQFFEKVHLPNLMRKTDYHILAEYLDKEDINDEIIHVLDQIYEVAKSAQGG